MFFVVARQSRETGRPTDWADRISNPVHEGLLANAPRCLPGEIGIEAGGGIRSGRWWTTPITGKRQTGDIGCGVQPILTIFGKL